MSNVLVVEDDRALAQVFQQGLERVGFQVINVGSCAEALNTLMRQEIQIVILDMNLPDAPGTDVLNYMESEPSLTDIPTIVLTAYTRFALEGRRAKVTKLLTKPVSIAMLLDAIDAAII
jgi:CheY-like chemotaxis protein